MATKKNQKLCSVCKEPLENVGSKQFHEGRRWGVLGEIGELMVAKEYLRMYRCPSCKKIEFYQGDAPKYPTKTTSPKEANRLLLKVFAVVIFVMIVALVISIWF